MIGTEVEAEGLVVVGGSDSLVEGEEGVTDGFL